MPLSAVKLGIAKGMFDVNAFAIIGVAQAFSSLHIACEGEDHQYRLDYWNVFSAVYWYGSLLQFIVKYTVLTAE